MKVLELFAGHRSIGKAFEAKGHEVYSIDWDESFSNIDLCADIGKLTAAQLLDSFGKPDIIWASPDCTTYSIAGIHNHRRYNWRTDMPEAVSEYAKECDQVNAHVIELIQELDPLLWFIENPRGGLRKMRFMKWLPRYTVTYCQYGDTRMKPTDIWTNHPEPRFKPMCKNGDPCHEASPRNVWTTGTQGKRDKRERARIPEELCNHIVTISEEFYCSQILGRECHII